MADLPGFPAIEDVIIELVADLGAGGTAVGTDLQTTLPFIRVHRLGGTDDRITDSARIVVDAFESTRPRSQQLAEAVRQRLLNFPHVVGGAVIDRVTTVAAPQEVPWGPPNAASGVRRFTATYTVSSRR